MTIKANALELEELLAVAETADLDVLTDYLTDNGAGRLMLDDSVCRTLVACKKETRYEVSHRELIAKEIRLFGGNTLMNFVRGKGVPYSEILRDVATHVGVKFAQGDDDAIIERAVLEYLLKRAWGEMLEEEHLQMTQDLGLGVMKGPAALAALLTAFNAGGFTSYRLALIVANSVARAVIGRGLPMAANTVVARTLGVALGPIGWVVTGLWSIADLASPAYRVTVPCVVQIAYMRQKGIATATCPTCGKVNETSARFCSECGTSLNAQARN